MMLEIRIAISFGEEEKPMGETWGADEVSGLDLAGWCRGVFILQ